MISFLCEKIRGGRVNGLYTTIILIFLSLFISLSLAYGRQGFEKYNNFYKVNLAQGSGGPTIEIAGARNEYLSLLFEVDGADPSSFKIAVFPKIDGLVWQFYQVVAAPRGSADYDVLLPIDQGIDKVSPLYIWATAKIKEEVKPGTHRAEIVFTDASGSFRQMVTIKTWNLTLPADLPIPIMAGLFPRPEWFQRYGAGNAAQFDALIKKYLAGMREYKINALGQFYPLPVQEILKNRKIAEFPRFHAILSYALHDLGYRYFFVPVLLGAKTMEKPGSTFLADAGIYYRTMNEYLQKNGWLDRGIVYLWDEPEAQEYHLVYKSYAALKEIAPNLKTMMAGGEYGESSLELTDVVDILVIYAKAINPGKLQAFKEKGQQIWLYANRFHGLGQLPVHPRSIGWFLYNQKFSGYFFWGVNYWPQDPWTTPAGRDNFWRRGTFFYPHPKTGEPCPSVRLEAVRQGLQDYFYLQKFDEAHRQGLIASGVYETLQKRIQAVTQNLKKLQVPVTMAEMDGIRWQIGEALHNLQKQIAN